MRMVADADRAGTHRETAGLNTGLAQSYRIGRGELTRERGDCKGAARECRGVQPSCPRGASGAMKEFTAFHGASCGDCRADCLLYRRASKAFGYQWRRRGEVPRKVLSLLDNLPMSPVYMSNV